MINNVTLVGCITHDPELRYTPAVATFSLAVNRQFKNANGDREADFINCVIWRQQAENLATWAKKGALIGITGRIQTRNYEKQQGRRVYVTEVVADSFQMLESRQERGNVPTPPPAAPQDTQKQSSASDPLDPFANSEPMDIQDDQLPF
ncbi:single-stranded DNA-binding protein [Lactococcus lactis subsp. lactis]|uniref:single-stranded DNA-binding protein n=1 Tax=Lactococcus lactis TaxID=1358 RepID=UPI0021AFACA1|nr:single-stranded DNA-binding protein [Lactococcus lactis]MCT0016627.1 single-stranded DNA-binding protein [Lactococcus lactis subsp. lactis]